MGFQLGAQGGHVLSVLLEQLRGVAEGEEFHIQGPALLVSAVPEQLSGGALPGRQRGAVVVDGLVEMAWVPLVGQGSVQIQAVGGLLPVDIDGVGNRVVQGRGQVEGRCAVAFQAVGHCLDRHVCGASRNGREIRLHPLPQVKEHLGGAGVGEGCLQGAVVLQSLRVLVQDFPDFLVFLGELLRQHLQNLLHGPVGAGLGNQQLFIIGLALRQCRQPGGQDGFVLQEQKAVPQAHVGGQQNRLQQSLVLGQVGCRFLGRDQAAAGKGFQTFLKGDLQEMRPGFQGLHCDNAVALFPNLFQESGGHGESGCRLFLFIQQERREIFVCLVQQGQIVLHVLPGAEGVLRQQDGQLGLCAGAGGEGFAVIGEAVQGQGVFQGACQQPPQAGVLGGELRRIQAAQRSQRVLQFGLAAQRPLGSVAGEDGLVVGDAEIGGIGQGVVEAQRVGFHVLLKEPGSKAGKALVVLLICKEECRQAQEGQQGSQDEEQLSGREMGILFQKIT